MLNFCVSPYPKNYGVTNSGEKEWGRYPHNFSLISICVGQVYTPSYEFYLLQREPVLQTVFNINIASYYVFRNWRTSGPLTVMRIALGAKIYKNCPDGLTSPFIY